MNKNFIHDYVYVHRASTCFIGVCLIEICHSSALLTSGIHDLNELEAQGQQAFASSVILESSPLHVNRVSSRAIREPPPNLPTMRNAHHQQKLPLVIFRFN